MYSEKDGSVSDVVDSISVPNPSAKAFFTGPALGLLKRLTATPPILKWKTNLGRSSELQELIGYLNIKILKGMY